MFSEPLVEVLRSKPKVESDAYAGGPYHAASVLAFTRMPPLPDRVFGNTDAFRDFTKRQELRFCGVACACHSVRLTTPMTLGNGCQIVNTPNSVACFAGGCSRALQVALEAQKKIRVKVALQSFLPLGNLSRRRVDTPTPPKPIEFDKAWIKLGTHHDGGKRSTGSTRSGLNRFAGASAG